MLKSNKGLFNIIRDKEHKRPVKDKIILIVQIIILGAFVQFLASYLLTLILGLFPSTAQEYSDNISVLTDLSAQMLIMTCIVAPLLEEFIFRGIILSIFEKFLPFMIANGIQATLFAVYHGNVVQGVYAFIIGFFIGCLLYITGSVIYTMIFHASVNACGMIISAFSVEDGLYIIETAFAFVSLAGIVIILKMIKNRSETHK